MFSVGDDDPEDLEDLWPRMEDPELECRHQARIEPVDAALRTSAYWALGGVGVMLAGVAVAAASAENSPTVAGVAGISGVVFGLTGAGFALAYQPSGPDQLEADARRRLFVEGEDDPLAVRRAVDHMNRLQRITCGGTPKPP